MISERTFAKEFTSFWQKAFPMGDACMRRLRRRQVRFAKPYGGRTDKQWRGFVNELAFRTFLNSEDRTAEAALEHWEETAEFISRLDPSGVPERDHDVLREVQDLASRLTLYFRPRSVGATWARPSFKGCGILNPCEGDLLIRETLYELKAGDRAFHLVDLKQVLTYAALAYSQSDTEVDTIGLVNPRTGLSVDTSLTEVCQWGAGVTPGDFFSEVIGFLAADPGSHGEQQDRPVHSMPGQQP